jgi:hypothetical protein
MVIAQENEHRRRHLSGDICCSVIFPGEERERKRDKGECERDRDDKSTRELTALESWERNADIGILGVSEAAEPKRERNIVHERYNERQHSNIKKDCSGYQRAGDTREAMKTARVDPREHWTAEARAVAYEYHRYQIGAGEGVQAPGRASGLEILSQRRGYGSAEGVSSSGEHASGQGMSIAGQNRRHTHQSAVKPQIPQRPKAMEYKLHQDSPTASLPAMAPQGLNDSVYEPPKYHWTPPKSANPPNFQSPIFSNRQAYLQLTPNTTSFSSASFQHVKRAAGSPNYRYAAYQSVGYLPPPPPPLSVLTDPTAVLACQTHYSPVTPFKAITQALSSPAPPQIPASQSPMCYSPQSQSPSPTLRPLISPPTRHSKVSDHEFHGHHLRSGNHCSRGRSSQSEPACKSDLKAMAEVLERDSNDETCDGIPVHNILKQNKARSKGADIDEVDEAVVVNSNMSQNR